jgi:hypothetical protein
MHPSFAHLGALLALALPAVASPTAQDYLGSVAKIKSAMLGSIRTSWEQGTAMHALNELDFPQYSVFGSNPFPKSGGVLPLDVLQLGVSAVTRQSADGRLSQVVNGDTDGAALDGASAGSGVWLGMFLGQRTTTATNPSDRRLDGPAAVVVLPEGCPGPAQLRMSLSLRTTDRLA